MVLFIMLTHPILRWAILLFYIVLLFYLSLIPGSSFNKFSYFSKIINFDKAVHAVMHFGLWSLIVWALKGPGKLVRNRWMIFIFSLFTVFIIGVIIELLQGYVGRSDLDWADVSANVLGALTAWACWLILENRLFLYKW